MALTVKHLSIRVWHFSTSHSNILRAKSILGTRICSSRESGICSGAVTFSPSSRVLQEAAPVERDMFLPREASKCSCTRKYWYCTNGLLCKPSCSITWAVYCPLICKFWIPQAVFHWKPAFSFEMGESWKFMKIPFVWLFGICGSLTLFAGVWHFFAGVLRVILVVFFPLFQCQVWFDPVKTWRRHLREVQSSHSNPKGSGSFTLEAGASNTAIQGKVAKRNPPLPPPGGVPFCTF